VPDNVARTLPSNPTRQWEQRSTLEDADDTAVAKLPLKFRKLVAGE
jgi:hypothetical protein